MNTHLLCKLKLAGSLVGLAALFTVSNSFAYDTSKIPSKPSSSVGLESGQVYDFGGRTIDGSGTGTGGLFRCFGKSGVTIRNVTVTGSPRYALIARGCSNLKVENFKMTNNPKSVGGIRFDQGTENKTVRLSNVTSSNQGGHGVELWDVNGFTIGTVKGTKTSKSALLLNRSRNGSISKAEGSDNSPSQGYATLRFANDAGPSVNVGSVNSKSSARGFFTVTRSKDVEVNSVSISGARIQGIYLQDSTDILVKGGTSRGKQNCLIKGGKNNIIKANCGGK